MWKILTFWCGGKWILLDIEPFPKLPVMCWLFLSLQLHPSLLLVLRGGGVLDSFCSSLSPNIVEALICTKNWLNDAKRKRPLKLQECMDNVEDMDSFEIDTGKYIYIYVHFVCCIDQLFIYLLNAYKSFYFEWDCRNCISLPIAYRGGSKHRCVGWWWVICYSLLWVN